MDTREDPTVVDLGELERRLEQRACWSEDPRAYRAGVHDALRALRGRAQPDPAATVLAG